MERQLPLACTLLALLLPACGSDDSSADQGTGGNAGTAGSGGAAGGSAGDAGASGSAGSSDGPRPSAGCGKAAPPADETRTLTHDGADRTYKVHVPPGYDAEQATPLILNFHGLTPVVGPNAANTQATIALMTPSADAAGYVVVYPQGLLESNGTTASWNAGTCCSADTSRDDLGFIGAMIDELEGSLCLDERRIFVTGLSNGGMLSHRLGCDMADRIAAVAPVAGSMPVTTCEPGRSVSVIAFHGTADGLVPYAGDSGGKAALESWVTRNGCKDGPKETFKNGDSHCDTWSKCDDGAEVVLCTVDEGGHTWPGGGDLPATLVGKTTHDMSANDEMWKVFQRHPLP